MLDENLDSLVVRHYIYEKSNLALQPTLLHMRAF